MHESKAQPRRAPRAPTMLTAKCGASETSSVSVAARCIRKQRQTKILLFNRITMQSTNRSKFDATILVLTAWHLSVPRLSTKGVKLVKRKQISSPTTNVSTTEHSSTRSKPPQLLERLTTTNRIGGALAAIAWLSGRLLCSGTYYRDSSKSIRAQTISKRELEERTQRCHQQSRRLSTRWKDFRQITLSAEASGKRVAAVDAPNA